MNKKMGCKNCGKEITRYNEGWWHITRCDVNNRKGDMFPEISLSKLGYIDSVLEACQSCGTEKNVVKYCEKPEPEVFFVEDESDEEKINEPMKELREKTYNSRMKEIDEEISSLNKSFPEGGIEEALGKKYDPKLLGDFLNYVNLLGQKVGMIWMKHLDSRIQFKIIKALINESNERVM